MHLALAGIDLHTQATLYSLENGSGSDLPLLAHAQARLVETARRKHAVEKNEKVKHMKNILIFKPIRISRKAAGGALVALLTTAAVSGGLLADETSIERIKSPFSVLAAEVGEDEKPSRLTERLYGTWTAKDVDAKMGEVKIRLTFRREKTATLMAWSDILFVGQVRDLEGPFSVHGNTVSSEAIREGKEATFSFESDQLVLRFKSGKVVRFDRE